MHPRRKRSTRSCARAHTRAHTHTHALRAIRLTSAQCHTHAHTHIHTLRAVGLTFSQCPSTRIRAGALCLRGLQPKKSTKGGKGKDKEVPPTPEAPLREFSEQVGALGLAGSVA